MKESEIQRMPIEKIFSRLGFALNKMDVTMAINLDGEKGRALADSFKTGCPSPNDKNYKDYIVKFLKNNEKDINKTTLIMLMLENYLQELRRYQYSVNASRENINKIKALIEKTREMLQGTQKRVYKLIENRDKTVHIETLTPQELISGKKEQKNNEKLVELRNNGIEIGDIIYSIILTDLGNIICDRDLGDLIRYQIFFNTAIRKGNTVDMSDIIETQEQIEKLGRELTYAELLPELEKGIRDNIEYIDFDKLVLCSAYRYIEYLDQVTDIKNEERIEIIRRLKGISTYLEGKSVKIEGRIEKLQTQGYEEECEYIDISYRVKDLKKDMEKLEGTTYWGKAKVAEVKQRLLLGEIYLSDIDSNRLGLSKEELKFLATMSDENYLYIIENGLIDVQEIHKVNAVRETISKECLAQLMEQGYIYDRDLIELYMQGKAKLEDITELHVNLRDVFDEEDVYLEYQKEDNDERKARITALYNAVALKGDEEKEKSKQRVFDKYLDEMNCKYLELFINIGTLDYEDLYGIMSGKEWIEAFQKGEISEDFFAKLQEHSLISAEDIKKHGRTLDIEIRLWEEGKVSSEKFSNLGIPVEELLFMCEQGKIKGTRIGEILSEEELKKYERKIISNYTYGMYDTIRPALAAYNSNIINRDRTIEIIKAMKTSSSQIDTLCEQGLLDGTKIAELRYKGVLSKGQFKKLKEKGLVSDEQEIDVANNLTPEEMLKELEANGCTKIESMEEILSKLSTKGKQGQRTKGNGKSFNKRILNPIKRHQVLEILGTDTIVSTPENGFNGYQAFLIPKLGIAVLEKLFRKDRQGEVKQSYGDATYICEIGKYIQVSGQSKREVRDFMNVEGSANGNVTIINHTSQWGEKLIKAIQTVNPDIMIEKNNGEITSISRGATNLNIDIKELNKIISLMSKGELSISLEEYE